MEILSMAIDISHLPAQARVSVAILSVTAATLTGIALHEDYRETAYIPTKGDVLTIGYGTTKGVKRGDKTTPARALMRLYQDVEGIYADGLKKCINAPLYPHEFGALVSLSYSVGVPTVCRKAPPGEPPNLIDLINSGRYAEACERINAFNKGPDGRGGKMVMPGLVKRRAAEAAMCRGELEGGPRGS